MKKAAPKKIDFLFRLCLLNCVLTGLLFSCGEGIRLFPFPETEPATVNRTNLDIGDKIPYQINVHRLEDSQGSVKTKSQRGSQHHYWVEDGILIDSTLSLKRPWKKFNFAASSENLKLPLFSRPGESRAPPFDA